MALPTQKQKSRCSIWHMQWIIKIWWRHISHRNNRAIQSDTCRKKSTIWMQKQPDQSASTWYVQRNHTTQQHAEIAYVYNQNKITRKNRDRWRITLISKKKFLVEGRRRTRRKRRRRRRKIMDMKFICISQLVKVGFHNCFFMCSPNMSRWSNKIPR